MLMRWGVTTTTLWNGLLFLVLCAMISLNVYLYRLVRKGFKERAAADDVSVMDWSQNQHELEIDFPLPASMQNQSSNKRNIECKITATTIRFAFKGDEPMMEGRFYKPVAPDDCHWQFWPTGPQPTHVKLSLTKASPAKWTTVLSVDATGKLQNEDRADGGDTSTSKGKQKRA